MAEKRGGSRPAPKRAQLPAGPGALSNRGGKDGQAGITPQPVQAPSGLPYGNRQVVEAAQQSVPLPNARTASLSPSPAAPPPPAGDATPVGGIPPNFLEILGHQTQRPNESITTGMLPISEKDRVLEQLRAAFRVNPNEHIRELIEEMETELS